MTSRSTTPQPLTPAEVLHLLTLMQQEQLSREAIAAEAGGKAKLSRAIARDKANALAAVLALWRETYHLAAAQTTEPAT